MKHSLEDVPPKRKVCRSGEDKSGGKLVAYREAFVFNCGEDYKWNDCAERGTQSAEKNSASAIIEGEVEAVLFSKYEERSVIWL